jgi:protease-4
LLFFGYLISVFYIGANKNGALDGMLKKETPFVAEVVLSGVIQSAGSIDADETIKLLRRAFESENAKAVILRMNSPGGSPVQSSRIYKAIVLFKHSIKRPIFIGTNIKNRD